MRKMLTRLVICVVFASVKVAFAQQACEQLKNIQLDHATVESAVIIEHTVLKEKRGDPPKEIDISVPWHCEVTVVARPTSDSEIGIVIWLPSNDAWNGKYVQRGNGGWAGLIQRKVLEKPLSLGYAVSATDDGHRALNAIPDASWAVGHPQKLIDFGYRSEHKTAEISKDIAKAFYGREFEHAYFEGCSDGGREALMEAERFPEDFDGIIAGAPANNWTHLFTAFEWNEVALDETPESKISAQQLPLIEKTALAACDGLDGIKDGLIDDPRNCSFDPSVLLCRGAATADCLTRPQINALKKIYDGPRNPRTGIQIYPGYEPGTEAEPDAWALWIVGPVQSLFGNSFFAQAVFEKDHWDWKSMDFDRDVQIADEKTAWILNSTNPDLRSFRDHGGKLIQYHGWGDAAIAPRDSINFYESVRTFLDRYPDPRWSQGTDIRAFYRLFMVPGLGHCTGGPGPTSFGNDDFLPEAGRPDDADHDVFLALDRWVTEGIAPEEIIADGTMASSGGDGHREKVPMTRPLCPFPEVARYKGMGNTNSATNFACVRVLSK